MSSRNIALPRFFENVLGLKSIFYQFKVVGLAYLFDQTEKSVPRLVNLLFRPSFLNSYTKPDEIFLMARVTFRNEWYF